MIFLSLNISAALCENVCFWGRTRTADWRNCHHMKFEQKNTCRVKIHIFQDIFVANFSQSASECIADLHCHGG